MRDIVHLSVQSVLGEDLPSANEHAFPVAPGVGSKWACR
jgi:hypothetical protein